MVDESSLRLTDTPFREREFTRLWTIATATYGVGDIVTTIALLNYAPGIDEGNVLLAGLVASFGQAGLIGLKLAVFLLCIGISVHSAKARDPVTYYLPPVALTLVGTFTTVYNIRLMMG